MVPGRSSRSQGVLEVVRGPGSWKGSWGFQNALGFPGVPGGFRDWVPLFPLGGVPDVEAIYLVSIEPKKELFTEITRFVSYHESELISANK